MYALLVHIHVKEEHLEEFKKVTLENAKSSTLKEPGCRNFDVLQQSDDPTRFVLYEVYSDSESAARHKDTPHYNHWRQVAEPMMVETRTRQMYEPIHYHDRMP
jgi:(4S)-4-hydroxy-5-phosphonooxypentane-2,3-dione isomerase